MSANISRIASGAVLAIAACCHSAFAAEIPWSTDIESSLQLAASKGRPVLMEFTADWCVFCKKMEKNTFPNPEVAARISRNFVAVRVEADQLKDLVKDLGIKGLPAILIVSPDLKVIKRISGFQTPEALITQLDSVTKGSVNQPEPSMIAKSNAPTQRPVNQPQRPKVQPQPQQQQPTGFDPNSVAASRPQRRELEFEAITQEEAPRVGSARPRSQTQPPSQARPKADPAKHQSFDVQNSQDEQPAKVSTAKSDTEAFFKTISREHESKGDETGATDPAFAGLCIVSALEDRELVHGSARNQITYRGHQLYFSSADKKAQFLASPATYWPMLDGACAMTLLEDEKCVEGSLEFAAVFRKRIWLFASQQAMREFLNDPADVTENAIELAAELQR